MNLGPGGEGKLKKRKGGRKRKKTGWIGVLGV